MHVILIILAVIAGASAAGLIFEWACRAGEKTGRAEADALEARVYTARHDRTAPRVMPLDPFSWAATEAIVDEQRERLPASTGELRQLASAGELRRLYERPYPRPPAAVTSTAELRALALEGDAETITAIVDAWKTDIDNEELA
jgi:hypothetical protein